MKSKKTEQFEHPNLKFLCPGASLIHCPYNISQRRGKKLKLVRHAAGAVIFIYIISFYSHKSPSRKASLREV